MSPNNYKENQDRNPTSVEASMSINEQNIFQSKVKEMFKESIIIKQKVMGSEKEKIVKMARSIAKSIEDGGKVLSCGNGGSAADAQHLAAELLVRLRPDVNRQGIPAIALAMDTSSITATGNDYGFELHYERMVTAIGKPGDVLIAITTSGLSENINKALRSAREKGLTTIGLLGSNGGNAVKECDLSIIVPSSTTGRIQESHITIIHVIMELVEDMLISSDYLDQL